MSAVPESNPYRALVADYADLLERGWELPLGGMRPGPRPRIAPDAPLVLLFSPHPDDECIIAGLALRLRRQCGYAIGNVPVTLGSRVARRAERWRELTAACDYLGFGLLPVADGGLERIDPDTRAADPEHWLAAVAAIADLIARQRPVVIFLPHADDGHPTHSGTHDLVCDALARQPADFACHVVETEFWQTMASPNLLVESSVDEVAELLAALSHHLGEVRRNPYHLRLPAWLIDNVRRGAERVGGPGAVAPDMTFATLYRLSRWRGGALQPAAGGLLANGDDPGPLFR